MCGSPDIPSYDTQLSSINNMVAEVANICQVLNIVLIARCIWQGQTGKVTARVKTSLVTCQGALTKYYLQVLRLPPILHDSHVYVNSFERHMGYLFEPKSFFANLLTRDRKVGSGVK